MTLLYNISYNDLYLKGNRVNCFIYCENTISLFSFDSLILFNLEMA